MSTAPANSTETIVIRSSTSADEPALEALRQLDSGQAVAGSALLAEVDGVLRAALPLDGGRALADPFAPTAHLVKVLEARLSEPGGRWWSLLRRRPATAPAPQAC